MASYSNVTVSNYNQTPPPDDGSQTSSNKAKWSDVKTKLGDPLKTAIEAIDTNVDTAFTALGTAADVNTGTSSGNVPLVGTSSATDALAGLIEVAVQSEMEAASSTSLAVTPGRQHFHPGVAKAWVKFDAAGSVEASYPSGFTIDDDAAGEFGVNWPTAFSSADYAVLCTAFSGTFRMAFIDAQVAGSADPRVQNTAGTDADPTSVFVAAFGDFA